VALSPTGRTVHEHATDSYAAGRTGDTEAVNAQPDTAAPTYQVVTSRFVTVELAAILTGFTPAAIRTKIARGVWLEDRHYVKRDGRVLIDMRGYEKWAESEKA
jgi:hypothetical protein